MFTSALSALLVALVAPLASAAPAAQRDIEILPRQAGPSGYVVSPAGGSNWYTSGSGNVGYPSAARVIYQGVSQDFTRAEYTHFETVGVDVYAALPDLSGTPYYLAKGLAPVNGNLTIDVEFLIPRDSSFPVDANSQFRLVFVETQFATNPGFGSTLSFQSAAPLLNYNVAIIP